MKLSLPKRSRKKSFGKTRAFCWNNGEFHEAVPCRSEIAPGDGGWIEVLHTWVKKKRWQTNGDTKRLRRRRVAQGWATDGYWSHITSNSLSQSVPVEQRWHVCEASQLQNYMSQTDRSRLWSYVELVHPAAHAWAGDEGTAEIVPNVEEKRWQMKIST